MPKTTQPQSCPNTSPPGVKDWFGPQGWSRVWEEVESQSGEEVQSGEELSRPARWHPASRCGGGAGVPGMRAPAGLPWT